jgi:hypothetical protein
VEKIRALWDAACSENENGLLEAMSPIGEWVYGTAIDTWGTKWDIDIEGMEFTEESNGVASISGYADSAWSPPIEAFENYSAENPDVFLELRYFEPGMGFIGTWDSEGNDYSWQDVGSPEILNVQREENTVLHDLLEDFNVWEYYDFDEDEDVEDEDVEDVFDNVSDGLVDS